MLYLSLISRKDEVIQTKEIAVKQGYNKLMQRNHKGLRGSGGCLFRRGGNEHKGIKGAGRKLSVVTYIGGYVPLNKLRDFHFFHRILKPN